MKESKALKIAIKNHQDTFVKKFKEIDYKTLALIQAMLFDNFTYISDDKLFNKPDLWNTRAFEEFMINGSFKGDCDDFAYCIIEYLIRVFKIPKKDIYRVTCLEELGGGHYVAWCRITEGLLVQIENRFREPRTLRWFNDYGYKYTFYAPMRYKSNTWFKPDEFASYEIYKTPKSNIADNAIPNNTFSKAFKVTKSKTLAAGWTQTLVGIIISIFPMLQSQEQQLEKLFSPTTVGSLLIIFGILSVILRVITNKDIDEKRSLND